jgi:hypothetical protein
MAERGRANLARRIFFWYFEGTITHYKLWILMISKKWQWNGSLGLQAKSMTIKLSKFGEILISHPDGRDAFLAMKAYLTKGVGADEKIEVDFSGIKVIVPSWADEVITKLAVEHSNLVFLNTDNPTVQAILKTLSEYSDLKIPITF